MRKSELKNIIKECILESMHNQRHGSPYDRGKADKWYGRYNPHFYEGATGDSPRVKITQKSHPKEWQEYHSGYDSHNERKE